MSATESETDHGERFTICYALDETALEAGEVKTAKGMTKGEAILNATRLPEVRGVLSMEIRSEETGAICFQWDREYGFIVLTAPMPVRLWRERLFESLLEEAFG